MTWKHMESCQQFVRYAIVFSKENNYLYLLDFVS
jgi:hypothetical protein